MKAFSVLRGQSVPVSVRPYLSRGRKFIWVAGHRIVRKIDAHPDPLNWWWCCLSLQPIVNLAMWRPGQRVNNLDKLIDANLTVPTAVSENPLAATRCSEGAICAIRANVYDIVDENGFQEANSALPQDAPRDLARDVIHPPKPLAIHGLLLYRGVGPLLASSNICGGHLSCAVRSPRSPPSIFFTGADRLHLLKITVCQRETLLQPPQSTARMSGFFTIRSLLWQRQIRNGLKDVH
jgi:hypothetical protein